MITLILCPSWANYTNEIQFFTTTICSGLVLPIIYFTTPLQSTLTQDVNQLSEENYKYDPNQGMLFNISKGVEAYDAWAAEETIKSWVKGQDEEVESAYDSYLTKEQKAESDLVLDQLWEDLKLQNRKYYDDFLANKEEYRADAKLFDRTHSRRLCNSNPKIRKARNQAKKASRFSLFNRSNSVRKI